MAKRKKTPVTMFSGMMAPMALSLSMVQLSLDAQKVIALRTAGMMGLWKMPKAETVRMVSEKQQAAALAARAFSLAMARGESPDRVIEAALKPIQRKARANARRLTTDASKT